MKCPKCSLNILHCSCPTTAKELEQADKQQERNSGYKPSFVPSNKPDKNNEKQ